MKRIKISAPLFILALIFALLAGGASMAQENPDEKQNQQAVQEREQIRNRINQGVNSAERGVNFIDEDGNGICDRYEQGQGMRQNKGQGIGQGRQFKDSDGDGICDYRSGSRTRRGGGNGHRSGYNPGTMGNGGKR